MNTPTTSKLRQLVFSVPEGGEAILQVPDPISLDTLDMLEQTCALMFRGLRRRAIALIGQDAGNAEYESWFTELT